MSAQLKQLSPEALRDLCDTLMTGGVDGGTELARAMVANGHTQRSLYLDVLSTAARQLGELWKDDKASFLSVHVAANRIENIIRQTAMKYIEPSKNVQRDAVFASVPGEEHTIGLKMAAELHRSKGWNIHLVIGASHDELLRIFASSPANILGLSIGSSTSMSKLYKLVDRLKEIRPSLKIIVCGSLVAIDRRPIVRLGVDAYATTLGQAERKLEAMARQNAKVG